MNDWRIFRCWPITSTLICEEYGTQPKKITDDAIKELQKITWTGNIREFRNVLERLIILCDKEITGKDVMLCTAHLKVGAGSAVYATASGQ